MIKSIGINKIVIILILAAFAVAAFMYNSSILKPAVESQKRDLSRNEGSISEMTENLNKLSEGLDQFEVQKNDFERIQNLGFFDPQNRVEAKQRILAMQTESRLISAQYNIKPAQSFRYDEINGTGHKILKTDIEFNLEALSDADIYKFIYLLNYGFPGQVIINELTMSIEEDIDVPMLQKIGSGEFVSLVSATVNVSWKTMVPDESLSVSSDASEGGSQ